MVGIFSLLGKARNTASAVAYGTAKLASNTANVVRECITRERITKFAIGYNLFVGSAVLLSYITNQKADRDEYLGDVRDHYLSALLMYARSIAPNQASIADITNLAVNLNRMNLVFNATANGFSTIAEFLRRTDLIINHGLVNLVEIGLNLFAPIATPTTLIAPTATSSFAPKLGNSRRD